MKIRSVLIPLFFLSAGFAAACFICNYPEKNTLQGDGQITTLPASDIIDINGLSSDSINPFSPRGNNADEDDRITVLENDVARIMAQLKTIETSLQTLSATADPPGLPAKNNNRLASALSHRLYSLDSLLRGGIEPSIAEDIVRRKNSIELKRLELQDRATRENYLDTPRYFDELKDINKDDMSLREELGDERYDDYLFNSKQNNRILISSVMLGSIAEQAGIQKKDVVLSYDNKKMYTWQELKDATSEGQLGEYVSISIY
ncbi:MAG: PDZ domain-containing protein, partial [Gammaproteobacteria bacterium]|nr:PDZ domain-containing protein [Gammaproteobacteria bacterium]